MTPSVPTSSSSSSSVNLNSSLLCRALNSTRTAVSKYGLNKPQAASFRRLRHTDVSLRGTLSWLCSYVLCRLYINFECLNIRVAVVIAVANERAEASSDATSERSEADKIVDGMDFGELCNNFECISSPLVESTARQLVRDILELRQGNRAFGSYAISVKYKVTVTTWGNCMISYPKP